MLERREREKIRLWWGPTKRKFVIRSCRERKDWKRIGFQPVPANLKSSSHLHHNLRISYFEILAFVFVTPIDNETVTINTKDRVALKTILPEFFFTFPLTMLAGRTMVQANFLAGYFAFRMLARLNGSCCCMAWRKHGLVISRIWSLSISIEWKNVNRPLLISFLFKRKRLRNSWLGRYCSIVMLCWNAHLLLLYNYEV